MMNSKRQCQIKDHESNNSKYICTFNDCKLGNRWICSECLRELLHHHGTQKQDHIMKQQQFIEFALRQQELSKNDKYYQSLKELLKESEELIQNAVILKNQIINQINQYNQQQDLEAVINLVKNDFYKIENSQIQQIIDMNNKNHDQKQSNELLNLIRQQNQAINYIIKANEQRMEKVIIEELQETIIEQIEIEQYPEQEKLYCSIDISDEDQQEQYESDIIEPYISDENQQEQYESQEQYELKQKQQQQKHKQQQQQPSQQQSQLSAIQKSLKKV